MIVLTASFSVLGRAHLVSCPIIDGKQELRRREVQDWIDKEWKPNNLSKYAVPPRLFTVGRLDSQSTGLIFVTNDGLSQAFFPQS